MDTASSVFQITLMVVASVLGALMSNYLLPGKKKSGDDGSTITVGDIHSGGGDVTVGDTVLHLTADNRVSITVDAATAMAQNPAPSEIEQEQRERERLRREFEAYKSQQAKTAATTSSGSQSPGDEIAQVLLIGGGVLVGFVAAVVAIVIAYLQYRAAITTSVQLIGGVALAFTLSAVVTASLQKVKLSKWLQAEVIFGIIATCILLYALRWLSNPVSVSDRAVFDRMINQTAPDWSQYEELFRSALHDDPGPYFVVFYQIMGVVLLTVALIAALVHTVTIYATIVAATRARRDPSYAYSVTPLHRWFMRLGGGATRSFFIMIGMTVLSLLLMSGLADSYSNSIAETLSQVSHQNTKPTLPSPSPSRVPAT